MSSSQNGWTKAINGSKLRMELSRIKREMFERKTERISRHDQRWEIFYHRVGELIAEWFEDAIARKVFHIGQIDEKKRHPSCYQCKFWVLPPGGNTKTYRHFRMCINPEPHKQVLSFNPYQIKDKEDLKAKIEEKQFFTHRLYRCKYGIRKNLKSAITGFQKFLRGEESKD